MKKISIETIVGIFLVLGLVALAYMSVTLGGVSLFGTDQYKVSAQFGNISGLTKDATVEIAGVIVGKVASVSLNGDDYQAKVEMLINPNVKLQEDTIASIRTQGIIGDKYVKLSPGASEDLIKDGGEIVETESSLVLEELVSKYMFDKK
ncbi:MAG: outer membrane lipid asymmetry maintenance protein MlaD [Thermodesulfovibrionia bacterium]|nr:outer membrane lipid asymmetry maintenance protein MlaD [Thermodesulfovibrionia bacterium]